MFVIESIAFKQVSDPLHCVGVFHASFLTKRLTIRMMGACPSAWMQSSQLVSDNVEGCIRKAAKGDRLRPGHRGLSDTIALNETAWEGAFSMEIQSLRRFLSGLMSSLISPILAIPDPTSLGETSSLLGPEPWLRPLSRLLYPPGAGIPLPIP